ncbi:DUF342 domain-containing protein [Deferribacter abyssi]|uniref:DUF342 domain-containing protein n=1 Tax=Deferribacter abyssi TaxID=213806 RepID=UPI003C2124E4
MKLYFLKKDEKNVFIEILKNKYQLDASEFIIYESGDFLEAEISTEKTIDAKLELKFLENDLILKISLYPAVNGKSLDIDSIINAITAEGVKEINMDRLREAYDLFQMNYIMKNVIVSKGIKPIHGKDARIIVKFKEKLDTKNNDFDGNVNFKETSNIVNVKKGELLLTKTLPTKGVPGMTVKGAVIPAKEGKDFEITIIEGVDVIDNGRKYVANVDGYVVFENNKIAVYPVYTVKEVNYETGNIDFIGIVHVLGDVLGDFKIRASKSILIDGVCEDAELIADEDIYVKTGIKGKLRNIIYAKKNIIVNFAENTKLYAEGDIIINNYMLNCIARAGGKITAVNGKGQIAGGEVESYGGIECNELGAKGSEKFNIVVGVNPFSLKRLRKLEKELEKYVQNLEKIDETIKQLNLKDENVYKNKKVKQMLELRKNIIIKIEGIKKNIQMLKNNIYNEKAKVRVKGIIHSGINIQIYNASTKVIEEIKNGLFFLEPNYNQVGWVSLEGLNETDD